MIDTHRIRERPRLKLVKFNIASSYIDGMTVVINQRFEAEIRKIFETLGFEVTRQKTFTSLSATKGLINLYCHPTHIMGPCDPNLISKIAQNLAMARSFCVTSIEMIHEIFDITPEQETSYYHKNLRRVVELMMYESFKTQRRNLYKNKSLIYDIGHAYKLNTMRTEQGYDPDLPINKFMEETYRRMVDEGILIESPCHHKCRSFTSQDKLHEKS